MNLQRLVGIAATGLALTLQCVPAAALEIDPSEKPEPIKPEVLFKGIVREDDVTLLFQHLRESMAAAARGEAARESEALTRRAEEIQREVAARSGVLIGALLSAAEARAKQIVRERLSEFRSTVPRNAPYPRSSTND